MCAMSTPKSKKQQLKERIHRAVNIGASQYPDNPRLQYLFALGFLSELLSYSAQDQWEVHEHLERYITDNDPNNE